MPGGWRNMGPDSGGATIGLLPISGYLLRCSVFGINGHLNR